MQGSAQTGFTVYKVSDLYLHGYIVSPHTDTR